jgi:hypothetical protein
LTIAIILSLVGEFTREIFESDWLGQGIQLLILIVDAHLQILLNI